jgi:hypothetical protein
VTEAMLPADVEISTAAATRGTARRPGGV